MNNVTHVCPRCGETKGLSEFSGRKNSAGLPYPSSYCRACQAEYARQWRITNADRIRALGKAKYRDNAEHRAGIKASNARRYSKNPDAWRDYTLKRTFGISLAEYRTMLVAQNGVCAICLEPCKSGRDLAVDHDHVTGKVRALLCIRCNNGLGNFRDNLELLTSATRYLADHQ